MQISAQRTRDDGSILPNQQQYLRDFRTALDGSDHFQEVGGVVAGALNSCERELMDAYAALEQIQPPSRTDGSGKALSAEEIKAAESKYDKELRDQDAKIQKMNIRYKRLQNMMELFQTIVKSHYETVQRIINNIPVRG